MSQSAFHRNLPAHIAALLASSLADSAETRANAAALVAAAMASRTLHAGRCCKSATAAGAAANQSAATKTGGMASGALIERRTTEDRATKTKAHSVTKLVGAMCRFSFMALWAPQIPRSFSLIRFPRPNHQATQGRAVKAELHKYVKFKHFWRFCYDFLNFEQFSIRIDKTNQNSKFPACRGAGKSGVFAGGCKGCQGAL